MDISVLKSAVNEMIERHESLRTCFAQIDGEPTQVIRPHLTVEVPLIDLSALDSRQQQEELKHCFAQRVGGTISTLHAGLWCGQS